MFETYVVLSDETLMDIANKYNTTISFLERINDREMVLPGDEILVPKYENNLFDYYVVSDGDTLYNIANKCKIDAKLLAELNGINVDDYIYKNQTMLIPKKGLVLYITTSGDTLEEIAEGFGVDVAKLVNENKKIYLQPEQLIVYKK